MRKADAVNASQLAGRLVDASPTTVIGPCGCEHVTFGPPPNVGDSWPCHFSTTCHAKRDRDGRVVVTSVAFGLPLALVRAVLGREVAAGVLARGAVANFEGGA